MRKYEVLGRHFLFLVSKIFHIKTQLSRKQIEKEIRKSLKHVLEIRTENLER